MLEFSEQIGGECAGPTFMWTRPDAHHSNPQLWANIAAAGLSMETPGRPPLSMEINTVALKLPAL